MNKSQWLILIIINIAILSSSVFFWPYFKADQDLASIISLNQKYQASFGLPLINDKSSRRWQASLLSANLLNSGSIEPNVLVQLAGESDSIISNIFPVAVPSPHLPKYLNEIQKLSQVRIAEKNIKYQISQDSAKSISKNYSELNHFFQSWSGKNTVKVAIIDTGINSKIPVFKNHLLKKSSHSYLAYNFIENNMRVVDQNGHGTHLASLIVLNSQAKIIPLQIFDKKGETSLSLLLQAFVWLDKNSVDIINLSFNSLENSDLLANCLEDYAKKHSNFIIAAAGNQGINQKSYPASLPEVIAVSSLSKNQ
nr:S8 family serine peptidase [Candidatus Gracilibacteria bacterium]